MLLRRQAATAASRAIATERHGSTRKLSTAALKQLVTSSRSRLTALQSSHSHMPSEGIFITPAEFAASHLSAQQPGYFPKLVSAERSPYRWSACQEWPGDRTETGQGRLHGLASTPDLQEQTVDVEVAAWGRGYGDGIRREVQKQQEASGKYNVTNTSADAFEERAAVVAWTKLQLALPLFFDVFIDGKYPQQGPFPLVGYLAQQDLFEQSPTLQRQCPPLPHAVAGERGAREQWRRNVWIGGAGTFTPIHCDPYDNLFVQVVGRKRVHIFPPSVRDSLNLFDAASTRQPNTSSIANEAPLLLGCPDEENSRYPGFYEAAMAAKEASYTIITPGDCLYIPRGWFHCVQSLDVSASVNAWFR